MGHLMNGSLPYPFFVSKFLKTKKYLCPIFYGPFPTGNSMHELSKQSGYKQNQKSIKELTGVSTLELQRIFFSFF